VTSLHHRIRGFKRLQICARNSTGTRGTKSFQSHWREVVGPVVVSLYHLQSLPHYPRLWYGHYILKMSTTATSRCGPCVRSYIYSFIYEIRRLRCIINNRLIIHGTVALFSASYASNYSSYISSNTCALTRCFAAAFLFCFILYMLITILTTNLSAFFCVRSIVLTLHRKFPESVCRLSLMHNIFPPNLVSIDQEMSATNVAVR